MKKLVTIILALTVLFTMVFTGCGQQQATAETKATTAAPGTTEAATTAAEKKDDGKLTIGYALMNMTNTQFYDQIAAIKKIVEVDNKGNSLWLTNNGMLPNSYQTLRTSLKWVLMG